MPCSPQARGLALSWMCLPQGLFACPSFPSLWLYSGVTPASSLVSQLHFLTLYVATRELCLNLFRCLPYAKPSVLLAALRTKSRFLTMPPTLQAGPCPSPGF